MSKRWFLLLASLTVTGGGLAAQSTSAGPRVIPVYMVPRDMSLSRERLSLTVKAIESVRQWYARVLRGRTFSYDPVIVQVSSHSFNEFAADSFQAWWPLLQKEFQGYGQDWEDDNTKMLWIAHGAGAWAGADSENGGIDSIREAGRVQDGDLGGLAVIGDSSLGGYIAGVCPDSGRTGSAWWCSWYTFMGTIAHELGHTWGLPHPDAFLAGFRCADTTAWTNMQCHWGFPFDSLLPFEQLHLKSLRHFRYLSDAAPFDLLTVRPDLTGALTRTSFEKGDSLLWMEGRGGGTGYIHGLVGRDLRFGGIDGWFVADIGLPKGSQDMVTLSLRIGEVERYRRTLSPGDPPLPISLPIRSGQRVHLLATAPLALGNARLIPRASRE